MSFWTGSGVVYVDTAIRRWQRYTGDAAVHAVAKTPFDFVQKKLENHMDERVERDLTSKVGYAKPPKHTRFTKGHSGNPKRRPTGSKNLATMMIEELTQTVTIVENGKRTKIPKFEQRFDKRSIAVGDFKALQQIVESGMEQGDRGLRWRRRANTIAPRRLTSRMASAGATGLQVRCIASFSCRVRRSHLGRHRRHQPAARRPRLVVRIR
jgi:hypothetical protein